LVRVVSQEELWNGNRESLRMMLSRESILLWLLRTYGRHRREYADLLAKPEMAHAQILRFASPRQAQRWLLDLHCKKEK
jgi:hypothetical protein